MQKNWGKIINFISQGDVAGWGGGEWGSLVNAPRVVVLMISSARVIRRAPNSSPRLVRGKVSHLAEEYNVALP